MASLGSYIFKPKHSEEIAGKIIESFARDHLQWEEAGAYVYWTSPHSRRNLPEGYVEFHIETEVCHFEVYSETCYTDYELSAEELTNNLFILLGEDFWHEDDSGKTMYTFEDRELGELVNHLAETGSRVIAYGPGKEAYISERSSTGTRYETIDTSSFLLNVPLSNTDARKQLTLPLA